MRPVVDSLLPNEIGICQSGAWAKAQGVQTGCYVFSAIQGAPAAMRANSFEWTVTQVFGTWQGIGTVTAGRFSGVAWCKPSSGQCHIVYGSGSIAWENTPLIPENWLVASGC